MGWMGDHGSAVFHLTLLLVFAGTFAFVGVLLAIVLRKPLLASTPAPPAAALKDLAFRLRAAGHPVEETRGKLKVKIDSLSAIKLHARPAASGTEVRYEVDATPLGWSLALIFAMVGYLGVVAVVLALVIHFKARGFARNRVGWLLAFAPLGAPPPPGPRSLLIEGLSEAQRLVSEALDYEREARQNGIGLVLLGSLALWVLAFFGSLAYLPSLPLPVSLLFATAAALFPAVLGTTLLHARSAPLVRLLGSERSLYSGALAAEATGFAVPGRERGGLELLLRAAERSATWREIRRRRKLWHDPVAGLTVFLFGYGSFVMLLIAAVLDLLPLAMRVGLGALGAAFAVGTAWFVRTWRRRVREEDERDRREWDARRDRLETEFWRILSG